MDDTGLASFNSVHQNTKSPLLAILDLKNCAFDKLYLNHRPVGTRGDPLRDRHWHDVRAGVYGSCERVRLSAPDTNAFENSQFFVLFRFDHSRTSDLDTKWHPLGYSLPHTTSKHHSLPLIHFPSCARAIGRNNEIGQNRPKSAGTLKKSHLSIFTVRCRKIPKTRTIKGCWSEHTHMQ
jgi:hypothetical protein